MARYPTGQPIRLSTTVRDVTGALVNAGALTLLVKIRNADGTSSTTGTYATPVNDSTGNYHQDVPVTDLVSAGHYQYTWTATGTGAGVSFGDFDVFDPFEPALLPLQDAKDILRISQADTSRDGTIARYVATIESCLERMTGGPLLNTTISERAEIQGNYTVLIVRQRPLVSVTSIVSVASGQALDISAGLDLDVNAGTIRRKLGYPFYGPAGIILQNLWETQHGPSARPSMGAGSDMVTPPGFGFAIPNQAAELLDGSLNGIPFMSEAFV